MNGPYRIGDDVGTFMLVSEVKVDIANAAYDAGAEAMQERCAKLAEDGQDGTAWPGEKITGPHKPISWQVAEAIRALPLHPTPEGQ